MVDTYDLGAQFFLWEMATAVAGHILDIHPFDQPNVEAAKLLARKTVAAYGEHGTLPDEQPAPLTPEALHGFLKSGKRGDYIAIQAFLGCPSSHS